MAKILTKISCELESMINYKLFFEFKSNNYIFIKQFLLSL